MRKSTRLNDMMIFLSDKSFFNLKDIMQEYGISKSTAIRDIQSLEEIGMPIFSETGRNGLSILRPRSHSIRYREPSIPNVRATCIKKAFRC
ncbi:helix-turn-helix domain-containing protein [Enterocloster clostridioformis]|nr:helix-turn-helix domain-containing protein [Lachnoclostridium sp. YL32]OXE65993.1 helix-turn-helix domain-containing protein [Enterocloster clostridioformis]